MTEPRLQESGTVRFRIEIVDRGDRRTSGPVRDRLMAQGSA